MIEKDGQSQFSKDENNRTNLKASKYVFTDDEEIQKAEIIQALKCVKSNYSFASTHWDGKMFEAMFPYSKIAKGYKQNKTQSNYTIQYGIFPYLKDLLPEDLKDTIFTIKFDEPSTQQVNKQYDGHVQYPSKN